ncbi:unnamed protein product [Vicia faba]|uniref:Uncharacterized protein n=1 Tax=Vicia faba TaxID=3906 RepID=A0AAV0YIA1_VICFA|nr:unnamed protein product [Vicia faba]
MVTEGENLPFNGVLHALTATIFVLFLVGAAEGIVMGEAPVGGITTKSSYFYNSLVDRRNVLSIHMHHSFLEKKPKRKRNKKSKVGENTANKMNKKRKLSEKQMILLEEHFGNEHKLESERKINLQWNLVWMFLLWCS